MCSAGPPARESAARCTNRRTLIARNTGSRGAGVPTIIGGVALVPPRRADDCTCTFCGLFRARHYWRRAIAATAVVVLFAWLTVHVDQSMRHSHAPHNEIASAVGGMFIGCPGFGGAAPGAVYPATAAALAHAQPAQPRADLTDLS